MANRQFRQLRQSSSRPNRTWAGSLLAAAVAVPAASKVLLASFVLSNQGIDETVLRTLGEIAIESDQTAANEFQIGAVGMCVVTDTAIATGITALPDPVTDVSDDIWFMYSSFAYRFGLVTGAGFSAQFANVSHFDSKAKRVFSSGQSIAVVVANAHASHGFNILLNTRLLAQVRGTR